MELVAVVIEVIVVESGGCEDVSMVVSAVNDGLSLFSVVSLWDVELKTDSLSLFVISVGGLFFLTDDCKNIIIVIIIIIIIIER